MQSNSFFRFTQEGAVAHLSLNRPEKANCMIPAFWTELPEIIRKFENDASIRVLLITGEGKHFSAGMDISSFSAIYETLKAEPGRASYALRKEILRLQDTFNALEHARFPVIAAVHGACIGAGVDMISACDVRLAAQDTKFSIEEVNVGMTADVGTLQRLPKLIAPGIVKELALTGRKFTASEAKSWGFINHVYPDREQTIAAGLELASVIAAKSPLVSAGVKRSIDYARDHSVPDALEHIASWNGGMLRQEDLETAIKSKMKGHKAIYADLFEQK